MPIGGHLQDGDTIRHPINFVHPRVDEHHGDAMGPEFSHYREEPLHLSLRGRQLAVHDENAGIQGEGG